MSIKRGRCADATNFGKLCCKLMDDILMISCAVSVTCMFFYGFDPFSNYIPKKSSGEWREQFRVMGITVSIFPIFIEKPVGARDSQPHDMGYG